MNLIQHAAHLVVREPRRSLAAIVGITIASALVTSVLLFGAASGTTLTRRALADVPVDGQVVLATGTDARATQAAISADPAVQTVAPFDLAHFLGAESTRAGSATQTSGGVLIGVGSTYASATGLFGLSSGSLSPGAVAISRDLASNLGAVPGDSIAFSLPGGGSASFTVSGIVSLAGADLVLGPVDAAHRSAGANPPANVAVMALSDLERLVLPKIPSTASAADPSAVTPSSGAGSTPVLAPEPAVRRELHVRLDHAQLPGDPVAAQAWLDTVRRRIERQGAGAFQWVDDASAALQPVATDLAWGQILFIFLALPGVLLALALSRLAADATAETTRRHAALLRARGASRRDLRLVFMGATVLTALVGSVLGAGMGTVVGAVLFGSNLDAAGAWSAIARASVASVVLTTIIASLAAVLPLRTQLSDEIAVNRQELQRHRVALWRRLYLDVLALVAAVAVYVLAGGTGVHPLIDAEGNPTVTLALTSFVAPLLFWTGGTFLLLRVVEHALDRGRGPIWVLSRLLGPGGRIAGHSMHARAGAASRAIVVLGLAVSFATSVLVFDATYRQQQSVDAALTLGADLKAVPQGVTTASAVAGAQGVGVTAVTPFVDRVVYVGPEAQDLLAIDATTLPTVSPLADAFFKDATAADAVAALRARPDAILVSAETAKDYSIVPGDLVRIRVPDKTGTLVTVPFTMAGIALEFPTAPKDAFLVANIAYVVSTTGNDRISFILAKASGDPRGASTQLAARLGAGWQVSDLTATTARLANAITSVDLSGLVVIDVAFAVLIAAVGVTLFLLAGLAERRRELATLVAIGAEPRQVRASLVAETAFIGIVGTATGLITGSIVGGVLLQVLAGLFDPPANIPAVPVALIVGMAGAVAVALIAGLLIADRGIARIGVVAALRER